MTPRLAVHETGRREVIGVDIGEVESEAFWAEFLRELVGRATTSRLKTPTRSYTTTYDLT